MRIIGHGIDIIEVSRVQDLIAEGDDFEQAWFTTYEREIALQQQDKAAFFAGRCAAKEAVVKALGTGFRGGISYMDIVIRKQESGAPLIELSGGAFDEAQQLGVNRWLISISHSVRFAVATAIAIQEVD